MNRILITCLIAIHTCIGYAQNDFPTAENTYIKVDGGGIDILSPDRTGGWARGLTYYIHNQPTDRLLGLGMYGEGTSVKWFYLAYGQAPWQNAQGLYIMPNGNTGIGTYTPSEKLSVNGNIRAKEIKVEATNWPDYVFKPDYELMPLAELEQFIKANEHLPDIPKADEVYKEGVGLSTLNRKLLEKIEELTLHLIEQDKENKLLRQQNKEIMDDVKTLKWEMQILKYNR